MIGTLAVDWWSVTFGTARRGLGGAAARPVSSSPSLSYSASVARVWRYRNLFITITIINVPTSYYSM